MGADGRPPFALPPGARRFDAFEGDIAGRLGLGVSARLASSVGLDTIGRLVGQRSVDVAELLGATEGVQLLDPDRCRHRVVRARSARTPTRSASGSVAEGVNVWVNPAGGSPVDGARRPVLPSVRVSPHYLTDDDDLAALGRALARLG